MLEAGHFDLNANTHTYTHTRFMGTFHIYNDFDTVQTTFYPNLLTISLAIITTVSGKPEA